MKAKSPPPSILLAFLLPSLCLGQETHRSSPPKVPAWRLWREDLKQIEEQLPKLHKNAFFRISEKDWRTLVKESIERIGPKTDIPHFAAELLRVCSAIGDGHTQFAWPQVGFAQAPLSFFSFDDGIFVTAFPEDKPLLKGAKVLSLQGLPIAEALKRLRPFIPPENEAIFRSQSVHFLSIPSLLQAFGIGDDSKVLRVGIEAKGKKVEVALPSIPFRQKPKVPFASSFSKVPAFMGPRKKDYSYSFLQGGRTLYFIYNRCRNPRAFAKLVATMRKEIGEKKPSKFILDLRRNGGGSSLVITPLFGQLRVNPILKKAKRYCLISRRTFSSALLNATAMKQKYRATLVGEPTGGKPNHFGEVQPLRLKNSRLTVYYSTKHFKRVPGDPDSLVPDVKIPLISREVFSGKDRALDFCLQDKLQR
ncbi:MAG TPA: hypothetical protein ENK02_04305 [Planctomycetes bacterium]|nr:hypothetical protein [Planctomycetota bacterium]